MVVLLVFVYRVRSPRRYARVMRILGRLASYLEGLAPRRPNASEDGDDPAARHRRQLAEPHEQPKKLSTREERMLCVQSETPAQMRTPRLLRRCINPSKTHQFCGCLLKAEFPMFSMAVPGSAKSKFPVKRRRRRPRKYSPQFEANRLILGT